VPEDARARVLLAANYARLDREGDALRELNLAVTLHSNPWRRCAKLGKQVLATLSGLVAAPISPLSMAIRSLNALPGELPFTSRKASRGFVAFRSSAVACLRRHRQAG
jgi:hypothetical protein